MNSTQKIIIIALTAIIIALGGAIALNFMNEPVKTVELFENGTTIEVPESTTLKSHENFTTVYVTGKNTTIIGVDNNDIAGAIASKLLSNLIVENGEKQDNGLYKLDKKSIMEIGDELGLGYDEKNILSEASIGIRHNNTVNQSIIIVGIDDKEIISILNSVEWKMGKQTITAESDDSQSSSTQASEDPTYPFYADDGSIVGYYHVGDVVEHYDGLYQLKSNGEWVYIGEAKGTGEASYDQGYSDAVNDMADDEDSDDGEDMNEEIYTSSE